MNTTYFLFLGAAALVSALLFAALLGKRKESPLLALLALGLSAVLGTVFAKGGYFLMKIGEDSETLTKFGAKYWSFVSGCAGVVLAVMLTARILRRPLLPFLDAFAPCGALMVALARMAEGLIHPMELKGLGAYVENEAHCFFPLAVENEMMVSWFYAVFVLEAACALLCAALSLALSRKKAAPGRVFLHTAFFLCLPQVLCERLLGQCTKWGFVRIEQLLCALIAFGILLYPCIKMRRKGFLSALYPALLAVCCMALIILMEFSLDGKALSKIMHFPDALGYAVMLLALCAMASLSMASYHRLNKEQALLRS